MAYLVNLMSNRIKQLRLAKGMSLDELAALMGGIVSKQAISKYENNLAKPTHKVGSRLAQALGVSPVELWREPSVSVKFVAYRKRASLTKSHQATLEALVASKLEQRCRLQESCCPVPFEVPIEEFVAPDEFRAEEAAEKLRAKWRLGVDPIADMTAILEDHKVHVIEATAPEQFDGISAVAFDVSNKPLAAAVVSRVGVPGDRQRLNLAHELGHLVLKVPIQADPEKLAFRFGAAFLAPAASFKREVGERRTSLSVDELVILKKRFKMSMQAILRRFRDLEIISPSYYKDWCIAINRMGWRKKEPVEIKPEKPEWLKQTVGRCLAEGFLTRQQAQEIVGEKMEYKESPDLVRRRKIAKLSLSERRRILKQQANQIARHYEEDSSWRGLESGGLIDYDSKEP
jgi:Zn-dependent peptidase ImmA (M78 family)/DNA-binding XRE family transcriptional regulator